MAPHIRGQGQGWGPLFLPCSRVKTSQLNTIQPRQHTYILPQPSASSEELLLRLLQTMLKAPVVAARFRDLCRVELLDTSVVAQILSVVVLAFKVAQILVPLIAPRRSGARLEPGGPVG